jgi:phosphonate transport system ATP-binding protein
VDILVENLAKQFGTGNSRRTALEDVSFRVARGEMVALIGASGSGKSTLLRHIGGLIASDAGAIRVGGRPVQENGRISPHVRALRAEMGFIFQQFNLVGRLSVLMNVLAGLIHRRPWWRTTLFWFNRADQQAALEALVRVGLGDRATQRASTLSGGQQQRAAIARTLVQGAKVVLGDEPIASLDPTSARRVMDCLARINREDGVTCVVSLHQVDYAMAYCPRTIALAAGRVVFDGPSRDLTPEILARIYGGPVDRPVAADQPVRLPAEVQPVAAPLS